MTWRTATLAAKRGLDVCLGGLAFLAALPAMAVIGAAIWILEGRPVLFTQSRPGFRERSFTVYKFRTMRPARNEDEAMVSDGVRLTTLGRWLRRTSLDELPQLWSVLTGDLSLVGPRPLLHRYVPYMTARERLRHQVRPGITGWAQIQGRNTVGWNERLAHDVWYVEHWRLGLDLRILALTIPYVLRSRGAVADARETLLNLDEERRLHA